MLSVHSFENGLGDGYGHIILTAVNDNTFCCKENEKRRHTLCNFKRLSEDGTN